MLGPSITLIKRLRTYFVAYGGITGTLKSPFFLGAFLVTSISYAQWLQPKWIDVTFTLIPSLLGFSLGTYSILFSLVSHKLKAALRASKNERGVSNLEVVNAVFFHFIVVQVVSLMWAFLFAGTSLRDLVELFVDAYPIAQTIFSGMFLVGSFIGHLLLVYSVLLTIGAALAIYRLALIKDE